MSKKYKNFDDERLFQTARLINTICIIKSTLALYGDIGVVQSTVPSHFTLPYFDRIFSSFAYKIFGPINSIYPENANNIPIELNIFYRWHQLV